MPASERCADRQPGRYWLQRMDLDASHPSARLARKARPVEEGRRVRPGVEEIVDAEVDLEPGAHLVADVEIDLAVSPVPRELLAVADRVGTQGTPLQRAVPGPQIVHQDAERTDERRRFGDERPGEAEIRQLRR